MFRKRISNCSLKTVDTFTTILRLAEKYFRAQEEYQICTSFANKHEWGVGGYSLSQESIMYEGNSLICIKYKQNYITTCDDFFDYEGDTEITVELRSHYQKYHESQNTQETWETQEIQEIREREEREKIQDLFLDLIEFLDTFPLRMAK
jgi:hypothetical protein